MNNKNWYIVKTQKGYERKVRDNLASNIKMKKLEHMIDEVIYPSYFEIEEKNGKLKESEKAIFPGFIAIHGEINEDVWFSIRNTSGVFGLLGSSGGGSKPVPLSPKEYLSFKKKIGQKIYKNINVEIGQEVTILKDILKNQLGKVVEVDKESKEVKVDINGKTFVVKLGEIKY
jgi:transcriptional antiterminator NusG